jgi:hypothetical protein
VKGYGLLAVLLIRLQARRGHWVAVRDLAAHVECQDLAVEESLLSMPAHGIACVELHFEQGRVVRARIDVDVDARSAEAAPCA